MNNDRNDNRDWQEEKTVSIFGEKTVAEDAPVVEKKQENTEDDRNDKKGKWLTVIVAAAVVVVGIAVIMIWQSSGTKGESEQAAEEPVEREETAEAKEENTQNMAKEAAAEPVIDETGTNDAEAENGSDVPEDEEAESVEEKKAKKLYDLLAEYDALRTEDGLDNYMEIIPEGPVSEINWLMRRYNAGDDIVEISLEWERFEQAAIYYMNQLQKEEPLEYTYLAGETEDGDDIVLYINTERSIYYIGTAPSGSSGMELYHGTVYYDVKVNDVTGLIDFCIYDGLLADGKPSDVGEMIHVVDEINDHDGRLESATNAYCVDQNGNAITFYDIYNNEGGRWAEESEGEYDTDLVPEWEFGEY